MRCSSKLIDDKLIKFPNSINKRMAGVRDAQRMPIEAVQTLVLSYRNNDSNVPIEAVEQFVLSYCLNNRDIPGSRVMSEFLIRKSGKAPDCPVSSIAANRDRQAPAPLKNGHMTIGDRQVRYPHVPVSIPDPGTIDGRCGGNPFANLGRLDCQVLERAEVYTQDEFKIYHIRVTHPSNCGIFDIYFEISVDEEDDSVYYTYFLDGQVKYDWSIEQFINVLIKSTKTALGNVKSEEEYLANFELVRGNNEVYEFDDFATWKTNEATSA